MKTDNIEDLLSTIFVRVRSVYLLLGFGFFATAAILVDMGLRPDTLLTFGAWALGPYVAVGIYACVRINGKTGVAPSIILSGMMTISGVVSLVNMVYISPGAQSGVGVMIVPFLQYIGGAIFIIMDIITSSIIKWAGS